jgi:hypothetical protein
MRWKSGILTQLLSLHAGSEAACEAASDDLSVLTSLFAQFIADLKNATPYRRR